jgi:hypothetical protein
MMDRPTRGRAIRTVRELAGVRTPGYSAGLMEITRAGVDGREEWNEGNRAGRYRAECCR